MYDTVLYELTKGVAVITLNRPAVMNALSAAMRRDLAVVLVRAVAEARVVVFTGAGVLFGSGSKRCGYRDSRSGSCAAAGI